MPTLGEKAKRYADTFRDLNDLDDFVTEVLHCESGLWAAVLTALVLMQLTDTERRHFLGALQNEVSG